MSNKHVHVGYGDFIGSIIMQKSARYYTFLMKMNVNVYKIVYTWQQGKTPYKKETIAVFLLSAVYAFAYPYHLCWKRKISYRRIQVNCLWNE